MKIIHILPGKANPSRMNGVNTVVHELSLAQFRQGHKVEIWGITNSSSSDIPERPFPTIVFSIYLKILVSPSFLFRLIKESKDSRFHFHGGFIPYYIYLAIIMYITGHKFSISGHGNYSRHTLEHKSWKKIYMATFERIIFILTEYIHCLSLDEINSLKPYTKEQKLILITNGQKIIEIYSSIHTHFTFCGRIAEHHKGLDLLLQGYYLYKNSYNGKINLEIIGEGEDKKKLQLYTKVNNLDDNIIWHGALFGEEKLKHISQSIAFFHTSRHEGLPLAPLEAAALKVPLVISKETNLENFVTYSHCGIVLPQNTPEEIAKSMNQIETLHMNNQLEALQENAQRMIKEYFTWDKVAVSMNQLY